MNAILNISLDDKVCSGVTAQRRYEIVMAALRLCFRNVVGEIQAVSYDGPDGPVREHCVVATVDIDVSRGIFEHGVWHIASSLGQDCIAVVYRDGTGKNLGPRAERWPFDFKYFNTPAPFGALAAA